MNLTSQFSHIVNLISRSKQQAQKAINRELINLYWQIGELISQETQINAWGKHTVEQLATYISSHYNNLKGFSARNLWRMKNFYETYKDQPKLINLTKEISWSNNLHIISKTKTLEEKEFYLLLANKQYYSERELARIIDSGTYERTILADKKLSAVLTEFPINTKGIFKDIYFFDFLEIQEPHREYDLKKALINNLKKLLLELGPDFSFIAEEYLLQVGNKDFRVDLLFHHRELNCLICVELKTGEFQPEYLGKLDFYLEALDQTIKKPHENPSIGILICKSKENEVVKFAMSRSLSPTLVAEYQTKLIDKEQLRQKLHEITIELDELSLLEEKE